LRLYNTLTQRVEEFRPRGIDADGKVDPSQPVGLYVCGITPYDTTHLGHAFTYVVFDVLVRHLRHRGWPVRYVQNVTDIDDDILRRAGQLGVVWSDLAAEETAHFQEDMADLDVVPPDVYPPATDNIPQMQDLIATMLERGHAYVRDGNVYFRADTFAAFGRLSKFDVAEMRRIAAERGGNVDDPLKDDPLDFILWQATRPGEPWWPSPWGPGRPGWHIECSAMAMRYLGPIVDIHGGGSDLVFPHHECEIAQSEVATGQRPFVRIWMHTAMVRYEGEKMSKSLGNLVLVHDLLGEYHPDAIRLALLRHHYRESWEYEAQQLTDAAELAARLGADAEKAPESADGDAATRARFLAALDDDLNTPAAVEVLATAKDTGAATRRELASILGLALTAHHKRELGTSLSTDGREPVHPNNLPASAASAISGRPPRARRRSRTR
jgi:L-cysteine:1D-myo-inositol 2-amino-2-deoxy-alpha-D-glucopyranoside ligase